MSETVTEPEPTEAKPFDPDAFVEHLARHGLTRDDLSTMIRIGFAAAARGFTKEARIIADATKTFAPDHASWAITEYLCRMAERRRDDALETLERHGMAAPRAWEQAAELLLHELDPETEAARRAPVLAKMLAHGLTPAEEATK